VLPLKSLRAKRQAVHQLSRRGEGGVGEQENYRPMETGRQGDISQLTQSGVAVEKLVVPKFAKIKSCQDTLQTTLSIFLDICYPSKFGCFGRKASFSTATGDSTHNAAFGKT
jgi:hypothetical protein